MCYGLSDAGWREDAPASGSGSGMLRIPKHSAFTLWYRTGRGTQSALACSQQLRVPLRLRRLVFAAEC